MTADNNTGYVFMHLGFCQCGYPESVRDFMAVALEKVIEPLENRSACLLDSIADTVKENPKGAAHLILYYLDRDGIIEHGGSVINAWANEKTHEYQSVFSKGKGLDIAHPFEYENATESPISD